MERKITPKKGIYIGCTPDDDFCYGAFSDTDALVDSENMDSKNRIQEIDMALSKVSDRLSDPRLNLALKDARREADILRSGNVSYATLDNTATILETFYPLLLDLHNQIEDLEKAIEELESKL